MTRRRTDAGHEAIVAAMRESVRADAEDRPGVYQMVAADGEVLYVGKSKRLRSRLLSYFRATFPAEKGARIVREAQAVRWEYTPSEFAALLAELRLIKRHRPRFNVQMKRDALHYAFIKISRGPAPKLQVVRVPGADDGGVYYGPYHGALNTGDAVRELNDLLGLRDCSMDTGMSFTDQGELFVLGERTPGCIRYEIGKCLGPCVAACSEGQYGERLALAREFLDGRSDGPLNALRRQMTEASEQLLFERAASLRDKLARLEALREQFGRLRFAVESLSFVYRVTGHAGDHRVYLIRRGRVRAERPMPRTRKTRAELNDLVRETFDATERATSSVPAHEIDELLLLSSWFRRLPRELRKTRAPAEFLAMGWRAAAAAVAPPDAIETVA